MNNFDKCVTYKPCTDRIIISCKLGLWTIKGPYDLVTALRAEAKYKHFRDAGKYKNLPKEKSHGNSIKFG